VGWFYGTPPVSHRIGGITKFGLVINNCRYLTYFLLRNLVLAI